jgi:hypothetical protein
VPTVTVAPAGQVESAGPPLAFSRTADVQVPVQLTIEIAGTSTPAEAPAKVAVKPVLPALATVAPPPNRVILPADRVEVKSRKVER